VFAREYAWQRCRLIWYSKVLGNLISLSTSWNLLIAESFVSVLIVILDHKWKLKIITTRPWQQFCLNDSMQGQTYKNDERNLFNKHSITTCQQTRKPKNVKYWTKLLEKEGFHFIFNWKFKEKFSVDFFPKVTRIDRIEVFHFIKDLIHFLFATWNQ